MIFLLHNRGLFACFDALQKTDRTNTTGQLFALNAHPDSLLSTNADEDRLETVVLKILGGKTTKSEVR